jgi:type II secretory pathway component GspD/PulD (secretin)
MLALFVCVASVRSQEQQPEKKPAAKPGFAWTVKSEPILNLSLKAEKAKMSEVAHELSQRLKIPVFLGPERQKESISIEFSQLTLEPALQLMSPTVYVDYELDTGSANPPKALGIYFYDENQGEPPTTAVVAGSNQAMLIEGNTEDGVEPATDDERKKKEEEPLRVRYEKGVLTVNAKKQPLPLVMLKIGEELGVPIDIQNERMDPIDANISKLPIEDAVRQLSPNIKLYYRADLTRAEKRALRIVLAEPAEAAQPGP